MSCGWAAAIRAHPGNRTELDRFFELVDELEVVRDLARELQGGPIALADRFELCDLT